ncbi:MAG TPA: type II toxin-antitoxin system HicA family toxin [Candidatus Binatia bacterium]|nr:type II toxin-antitoxin system HicA family toxin [Candidatus Binatia bacterium]
MGRALKQLGARDVLRALGACGFQVVSTPGSHAKLRRILPTGERQTLTIPLHRRLAPGTLRAIFRQASRYGPDSTLRPWFFVED